jgi:pyrroline-5-carboxylate reductase
VLTELMPAVFYYIAEAMIEGGVIIGLPRGVATQLVKQTAYGAARMLHDSGSEPIELRYAVTSPAGTTASALRQFENHRVRAACFAAAVAAASQQHSGDSDRLDFDTSSKLRR